MDQPCGDTAFYSLPELEQFWGISSPHLKRLVLEGVLTCHVWIPLMSVFECEDRTWGRLQHWEGFAALSRHQCHRLFRNQALGIRSFSKTKDSPSFLLPETAEDVQVTPSDLVVLDEERLRFEAQHQAILGIRPSPASSPTAHAVSFRHLSWKGEHHHFGQVQANCLGILFEAVEIGQPWLNGKQLLSEAGSVSFSLGNLFKRKPIWRELITSDGRGNYRISEAFYETFTKKASASGQEKPVLRSPL